MIYSLIIALLISFSTSRPLRKHHLPPAVSIIPPQLNGMTMVPPGTVLANLDVTDPSTFIDITPEHASIMQVTDEDKESLKWVTNGTHVYYSAQYTYHIDMSSSGFIATNFKVTFKNWDRVDLGVYYEADYYGLNIGQASGWGTCWLNYGVEWMADSNWGANIISAGGAFSIEGFGAGGMAFQFIGSQSEDIGNCAVSLDGIQVSAANWGWGKFHR